MFIVVALAGWRTEKIDKQGPVVRSLVSANRWLTGIKTYRFPWYLTLVSANHALSNPGQTDKLINGLTGWLTE